MKPTTLLCIPLLFLGLSGCTDSKPGRIMTAINRITENKDATENVNNKKDAENDVEDNSAESNSNHLTFKGVPIDGTLDKFVKRMKQKGFKTEKDILGLVTAGDENDISTTRAMGIS